VRFCESSAGFRGLLFFRFFLLEEQKKWVQGSE
jgi:hypothetical protein